ncbi:hypothetical protein [Streptomyces sp. NPDC048665]|uniref:hypothetical protein n=1 Tax=Streptomyces sp. NPDC048665 TaxID=3155490 RepID=UPI00342E4970
MTQLIPAPRRRVWLRAALTLAAAGVLTLTGLPGLPGDAAYAAKGKRCDSLADVTATNPGTNDLPWDHNIQVRAPGDVDTYTYNAPRQTLDGLTLPGDAENPTPEQIKERDAFLDKFDKKYTQYPENSEERAFARYKQYLQDNQGKTPKYSTFAKWLSDGYILPNNNNRRGAAYETKVINDLGLVGEDWLCQEEIEIKDKDGNPVMVKDPKTGRMKPLVRKFDAVNYKKGEFLEFKAGPGRDTGQDLANQKFLEDPRFSEGKIAYVNGESKDSATTKYVTRMADEYKDASGQPRMRAYEHLSDDVPEYKSVNYRNVSGSTLEDPDFAVNGNNRAAGGAARVIDQSPPTPLDMERQLQRIGRNGATNFGVRGPGGIDFSTLDLAYVGKPVKGKGLPYAFSADKIQDESKDYGWGGKAKAALISDSFFTWLALTPDKFWVNLNPDQPDKIMNPVFGKTDAGRVLLQADLQLKHDYAKDMDPRQGVGKTFWDAMKVANVPCSPSIRLWIEPKTAKVRADDNGLYILDAPLKVSVAHLVVKHPNPNGKCDLTDAQEKTGEALVRQYVIPDVEQKVSSTADFADLRRVYSARVAAEYVRQQDAQSPSDYHSVINSGNIGAWPLRAPNQHWTPKQTWDDYMTSYTKGDYSYPCEYAGQQKVCVMGGVDFSKAPKRNITSVEFRVQHPYLPKSARTAAKTQPDDADNPKLTLLGGDGQSTGSGGGTPTPTPTGTPTSTPTHQPTTPPASHTPAPGHSTPAAGHTPPATPPGDDNNGGGLAHTGTQVLGIAGIAAMLVAAGAALVWFRRRHGTHR